jgi:hypothetical protein
VESLRVHCQSREERKRLATIWSSGTHKINVWHNFLKRSPVWLFCHKRLLVYWAYTMKPVDFCTEFKLYFSPEAPFNARHTGSSVIHNTHKYVKWNLIRFKQICFAGNSLSSWCPMHWNDKSYSFIRSFESPPRMKTAS